MPETRVDLTLASSGSRSPFLTYEPYYGLKEKPFSLSSDPRFLYKSRAHASVYDDLRAGIRRREGVIVLTGDIGTGKTTVCRSVLKDLDRKTFSTFVPDPFVSREDLLKMLLIDFGVMSVEDLKSGRLNRTSRPELSYPLYDFLQSLVPLQAFAVLVIDEAQNLPLTLLEELRILSDLEGPEKLLQVVLIGQLEFLPKLKDPQMRQLDHRVSVRCELHPLDRDGVAGYITHRLIVAGGGGDRVGFSDDAVNVIYKATSGNPRLINLVCDRSLHHGHVKRISSIGPDIVAQALSELGITHLTPAPAAQASSPAVKPAPGRVEEPLHEFRDEITSPETAPQPETERASANELDEMFLDHEVVPSWRSHLTWRWIAAGVIGLGVGISLVFTFSNQQTRVAENLTMPAPPSAMSRLLRARPVGVPSLEVAMLTAAAGEFEVGVALFPGPVRARRLEIELAAAGYQASTRALTFPSGRMYEVRTGPYTTRAAAEVDAARIRQIPGYRDARVIPPQAPPQ
jgi:type II secretory pathway predicted ATPase ExeA